MGRTAFFAVSWKYVKYFIPTLGTTSSALLYSYRSIVPVSGQKQDKNTKKSLQYLTQLFRVRYMSGPLLAKKHHRSSRWHRIHQCECLFSTRRERSITSLAAMHEARCCANSLTTTCARARSPRRARRRSTPVIACGSRYSYTRE